MKEQIPSAINDSLTKQFAVAALAGKRTVAEFAKEFNMPRHQVSKILNSPEYKLMVDEMTDKEVMPIINRARAKIARLLDKSIKVLEKHLDEDNLEGVKLVLKVSGLDSKPEERQADTNIQVILPSTTTIKEVSSTIIEQGE